MSGQDHLNSVMFQWLMMWNSMLKFVCIFLLRNTSGRCLEIEHHSQKRLKHFTAIFLNYVCMCSCQKLIPLMLLLLLFIPILIYSTCNFIKKISFSEQWKRDKGKYFVSSVKKNYVALWNFIRKFAFSCYILVLLMKKMTTNQHLSSKCQCIK